MIIVIFIIWIILSVLLINTLNWELFLGYNFINQIAIIGVLVWLIFTLLFACYHLCSFLFSLYYRYITIVKKNYTNTPLVAILYTCKNDFSEEAVNALLKQTYLNYDIYILDDSDDKNEIIRINQYLACHEEKIILVRRNSNKGFKAGNINNAIKALENEYKYINIIDADEIIPDNFVKDLVAIAEANSEFVFIQGAHSQYGLSNYSKSTGANIDLHWNYFLPARNKSGFLFFYGHGALFRLNEIKEMGGLPEIVSEDIALTALLLSKRQRGYFAQEVISSIEAPITYNAFRRKNKKIIQGTLEFYKNYSRQFFTSKNVSFLDKTDLILASLTIYLPVFYLFFILFLHIIIPVVGLIKYGTILQSNYWHLAKFYSDDLFVFFVAFTIIAPLCYALPSIIKHPIKSILRILRMGTIYLSGTICFSIAFIEWFFNKKVQFIPTGDRSKRELHFKFNKLEFAIGFLFVFISIIMRIPFLLALGLSLMFIPIILKNNLKTRISRFLTLVPFLVIFLILFNQPIEAMGIIGITGFMAMANP